MFKGILFSHQGGQSGQSSLLVVGPVSSEILIRIVLCKEPGRRGEALTTCIPMKGDADVRHS